MRRYLLSIVLFATAPAASAQVRAELVQRIDSMAGAVISSGKAVGMVVGVMQGNDTLLLKPYGLADVEWNVSMVADAMFEIGSQAKQFTAAAILQLRDEGKLSLDDDITKHLPDFNTRGHAVPLRRLLNHTSGIHDFTETVEFPSLVSNRAWPRDSAYALINRQEFDFAPGERQQYSNSGFFLLGKVIEKASGMTYEDYLEKKLFEPLGMTRSMYCNWSENVPRRAHGYGLQRGTIARGPTNIHTWSYAAGAICSTAGDVLTWNRALHGGKVLAPASYTEMTSPSMLAEGMPLRYGYGLGVEHDPEGRRVFNHGGIGAGFWSETLHYPDANVTITVLTNTTGGSDPEVLARQIGHVVVAPTRAAHLVFGGDAAPFLGTYKGKTMRGEFTLVVSAGPAGGIMLSGNGSPPRQPVWLGGDTFFLSENYVIFGARGVDGKVSEVGFNPAKGLMVRLVRQP